MNLLFSLPKVLQDIVNEYNVDHRPIFAPVIKQILYRRFIMRNSYCFHELCDDCYECIEPDELYIMIFIGSTMFKCCNNQYCVTFLEDHIRNYVPRTT